jgi:hypothetical protein
VDSPAREEDQEALTLRPAARTDLLVVRSEADGSFGDVVRVRHLFADRDDFRPGRHLPRDRSGDVWPPRGRVFLLIQIQAYIRRRHPRFTGA